MATAPSFFTWRRPPAVHLTDAVARGTEDLVEALEALLRWEVLPLHECRQVPDQVLQDLAAVRRMREGIAVVIARGDRDALGGE